MIERIVNALLRLCPRSFRREWGDELRQVYVEAWRKHARGGRQRLRLSLSLLADVLLMVPRAWSDERGRRAQLRAAQHGNVQAPWTHHVIDSAADVRMAARQWRSAPGFVTATVGTLALGMAASIAMFAVVNGVLLRPMPYADPDRVALVQGMYAQDLAALARDPAIAEVTTWSGWRAGFQDPSGSMTIRHSASVGAAYFELLGVHAARGRLFSRADSLAHVDAVVLAWHAWQSDFGAREDIVGADIRVDNRSYTVIGVAPEKFADPFGFPVNSIETSMYRLGSVGAQQTEGPRRSPNVLALVRLRATASPETVQQTLTEQLASAYQRDDVTSSLLATSAYEARVASTRQTLFVLGPAALLLLIIACVNASNLLLNRAALRKRELAVRMAIGGARGRILRLLLAECLLLAGAASALGLWAGYVGARAVVMLAGESLPRGEQVVLDWRVALFATAIMLLTTVAVGLIPAFAVTRKAPATALFGTARTATESRAGRRLRNALVGVEVALAVVLTFTAGLVSLSLWKLQVLDPGFDDDEVLSIRVTMSPRDFAPELRPALHDGILAALSAVPGVASAAAVDYHPLAGGAQQAVLSHEPKAADGDGAARTVMRTVTGTYFETMGITLLAGRTLSTQDRTQGDAVVVVSQSLATTLFPEASALERNIYLNGEPARIVGIVSDVKEFTLTETPTPVLYRPLTQVAPAQLLPTLTFVVRAQNGSAAPLSAASRRAISGVEPRLQIAFLRTMRDMMNIDLLAPRLRTTLFATFGLLAALLAAVGIAAVVGYSVSQRLPEFSLRLALGATHGSIASHVLTDTLAVVGGATVAGALGSLAAGRAVAAVLYQVPPTDLRVLMAVSTCALALALIACLAPVYRATRVQPTAALR